MWGFKVTKSIAQEQTGVSCLFLILAWNWEPLLLPSNEGLEKPNWNAGNENKIKGETRQI